MQRNRGGDNASRMCVLAQRNRLRTPEMQPARRVSGAVINGSSQFVDTFANVGLSRLIFNRRQTRMCVNIYAAVLRKNVVWIFRRCRIVSDEISIT